MDLLPGARPHDPRRCADARSCPLHRPAPHHMRGWPLAHEPIGRTYRRCPHGLAHPDPDDPDWGPSEHPCDGCCAPPRPPGIALDVGGWVPGVRDHPAKACDGMPCPLHDPSGHALRDAPVFHDDRAGLTMRRCEHDVFHPDPDDHRWRDRTHACDGCCAGPLRTR